MYFAPTSEIVSINNNIHEPQSQVLTNNNEDITPPADSTFIQPTQPNQHFHNFTTQQSPQSTISSPNIHLVNNPNINRLFVPSPPLSPMNTSALGNPNRSCSSCKKRKVKCDRKTPSCSACIKSKNRCLYTSYSPPFLNQSSPSSLSSPTFSQLQENDQYSQHHVELIKSENDLENEHFNLYNEEIMEDRSEELALIKSLHEKVEQVENAGRQRYEHIQKIFNSGNSSHHGSLSHPNNYSPYPLPQHSRSLHRQRISTTPKVSIKESNFFVPYKKANIIFNYNPRAIKSLLGPGIAPILNATTIPTALNSIRDVCQQNDVNMQNGNLNFPIETGFKNFQHLQNWIQDRFQAIVNESSFGNLNQGKINEAGVEKLELRPIVKESLIENGNGSVGLSVDSQIFEIIFYRRRQKAKEKEKDDLPMVIKSEPIISDGKEISINRVDQNYNQVKDSNSKNTDHNIEGKVNAFLSTNDDAYLEKIYTVMRIFVSGIPWIRENVNSRDSFGNRIGVSCGGGEWSDGVFENVVVELFDDQFEQ
ncbi:7832_t:CDS:2, partial [Ambispora gerdemannii]